MPRPRSGRAAEAALRFADRRRREDEAPRLTDAVPNLAALRLEVEDRNVDNHTRYAAHVRPIIVERAPAMFLFPCSDTACDGGGTDLTSEILRHLEAGDDKFEVSSACEGAIAGEACKREVHVKAIATRK